MVQKNKTLQVSIVIPVYNEADELDSCLQAIAQQTVQPFEVIVIDNNSTDNSVAIARSYRFVTVRSEPRQGAIYARNAGFNAATGQIIGRIDADTRVAPDWVETLQGIFADGAVDAVSGAVSYHDLPWRRFLTRLDLGFRQWIANGMKREVFLFGSNMALRREAWEGVKGAVCNRGGMHEDFDLAIHLHDYTDGVRFDDRLHADVSLRRFNTALSDYWSYVWMSPRTYAQHGRTSQTRMYPVVWMVILSYFVIKLLYKSYNPIDQTVAFKNLWLPRAPVRVDPTSFVD
jgi:glycosyltransferase involved in cell wall biosynthesis